MDRAKPLDRRAPSNKHAISLVLSLEDETNSDTICDRFQHYIENKGFTSAVCLVIDRTKPLAADDLLMCTRPRTWVECYLAERHMADDPILAALQDHNTPFAWSEVVDSSRLNAAGREVMGLAATHGMEEGLVIPITDAHQHTGLVSLAGPRRELPREDRAALTLVSVYVHQRLLSLRRQKGGAAIALTQREHEIVRWISEGKSDWQIGQILNISAKTVNYHVENVKRKFGVASRIQAVVAALSQGGLTHQA